MRGWVLNRFSSVQLCATLWSVACQAPLSMGFFRKKYWSGLLCPSPRDLPNPRDQIHVSYVCCIGRWVLYHLHHLGTCSQVERVEISRGKQAMSVSIVAFFNMCWAPSYREGTPQRNKWDLNILPGVTRTVWSHSNITATFSLFARQV